MKNYYKKTIRLNNAVEAATTTCRSFGFHTIPGKGGNTTNGAIIEKKEK